MASADFDRDGDLDVLVGVNQGNTQILSNQTNPSQHVSIMLNDTKTGPNKRGIGSSMLIQFNDGRKRLIEISAGSSYLSQNESRITLAGINAAQIATIKVRWPDGVETNWSPTSESNELVISRK